MGRRRVAIVPHTHWDREWYSPFQTFRMRLVDVLDEFLPRLEGDLSYARFLLDGQMAVVEDYLEVRPEAEPVLQRLAAEGRLAMGPWYTLPDEFLISGETHIRNVQKGLEAAVRFGGAMDVGYLPDMFGHVAQMPQILSQAGFGHAVVWRGVPSAIDRTGFWWAALDGTTVRAEYLPGGYGNGSAIPDDAKALIRRIEAHERELGEMLIGGILFMNGTDHQAPQPWLGRVVAEANDIQDDYELVVTSLAEYLADAPTEALPSWTGELRSGARANLLMGVASNRVDVKQAAARAERALEREAEPLCALFMPAELWPTAMLDLAWKEVLRNAAHDSVCACSVDEVCDAVLHRYAEARQIADGLTERALRFVSLCVPTEEPLVVNASADTRSGVVELVLPDETPVPGTQVLTSRPAGSRGTRALNVGALGSLLGQMRDGRFSENFYVRTIDIAEDDAGIEVVLWLVATKPEGDAADTAIRSVYDLMNERPEASYRVRMELPAMQRILARIDNVPGFGWKTWNRSEAAAPADPVSVDGTTMANGLVTIAVDPADGTFSVDGLAGFDRLVDDGDWGDTYNYSPPASDAVVDTPTSVEITVVEEGPVRAVLEVTRTFTWPERIDGDGARIGSHEVPVRTRLSLLADERLVRVETSFFNVARDHRLRAWFPLGETVEKSRAECAFAIVERGLTAEGGPTEHGLPTYPSRRFVMAGPVTVVHEGLLEYEVVDEGRALALTLLRTTGMLSRGPMTYRPDPAGPLIETEGSQMQQAVSVRYGVAVGAPDPYNLVDDAFLPLRVLPARGGAAGAHGPTSGSALEIEGGVVSALVRKQGMLEVRVFNPSDDPITVRIPHHSGWLTDLRGRPVADFDGQFELRPWGIATARLHD